MRLIMKKFLSICLVALMMAACVSVAAFAAANDWVAGTGYQPYDDASGWSEVDGGTKFPTTVKDVADGVQVTHGGTYKTGVNWGGVATKKMYNLDGLEISVRFDKVPATTADTDCWIAIDFLRKPEAFQTGNIAGNPGFMQLIRYSKSFSAIYVNPISFSAVGQTDANDLFFVEAGDVLGMKVEYVDGLYEFTYSKNGEAVKYDFDTTDLVDTFKDGKAHVFVSASIKKNASANDYVYTILSLKDGVEKTQEQIDNEAIALAAREASEYAEDARAAADEAVTYIEKFATENNPGAAAMAETFAAEADAAAAEAEAAAEEAKAATTIEEVDAAVLKAEIAKDAAKAAAKSAKNADEEAEKKAAEEEALGGATDENKEDDKADNEKVENKPETDEDVDNANDDENGDKDFFEKYGLLLTIVGIIVVVIIIGVVILLVMKKKKN